MISIFRHDENGRRPVHGAVEMFQTDVRCNEMLPFHEYFHGGTGKGIGASHQTGCTGTRAWWPI